MWGIKYEYHQSSSAPPSSSTFFEIFLLKGISKSSKSTSQPNRSRLITLSSISSLVVGCLVQAFKGVYTTFSCSSTPPASAEAARKMDPFL